MGAARFAVFISVVLAINLAVHSYLWLRLVRSPAWSSPWNHVGTFTVFGLALLLSASMYLVRIAPVGVAQPLAWFSFTWLGLAFLLFALLLVAEPLRPLLRTILAAGTGPGSAPEGWGAGRRLDRAVALAVLLSGGLLGARGVLSARLPVGVRTVRVTLARWPAELAGYTVVQLSDLHAGETIGRSFVESVVRRTNALDPDLIVITGDLVDGSVRRLAADVAPLAELHARDGVWFVTGNHEYYSGAPAWVEHLHTLGIRVLRNERVPVRGERGFDLAGTDDYTARSFGHGHGQDLPRALADRDPRRPVILLAHQPRSLPEAAAFGVDLQLSGHTHGGQIFPMHLLTGMVQPFLSGLHRRGDTMIYVSRGTGYWGPPMRVGAPSEITRIVLSP